MLKISLDTVGYAGYFYEGEPLSLEDAMRRAAKFGFDAVDIWPHRPIAFPMDVSKDRRKNLVDLAAELKLKFAAIEACTDFRRSDHILMPRQEKEILFVKECCELAHDVGCPVVRILAGFAGYFWHVGWNLGYSNTAMWNARTIEVSQEKDFLIEWEFAKQGIAECARIAADYGIILALQNHPPLTNNTEETLAMIEEIGHPNLKIGLDLPLFESQAKDFIWNMVKKVGKERMAHTHLIGLRYLGGMNNSWGFQEVEPEFGHENWIEFFKACQAIGYDGYFAHEQCSPIILKGHKRATIEEFDRRYQATLTWAKRVFADIEAGKL
jgi:sugar phosphate isomerase/epimerase